MPWTLFRVRFGLRSGVHSGSFPVGNILKTRLYVTGRTVWGAATAALVAHGLAPRTCAGFEDAGKGTREYLRFGYLFPLAGDEKEDSILLGMPEQQRDEFEYRFLDTYSSTALNYDQGSAEQGSLHEIEYIRPWTLATSSKPAQTVSLVGHLAVRRDPRIEIQGNDVKFFGVSLKAALNSMQVGGKRNYGFGRLRLEGGLSQVHGLFGGAEFIDADGRVRLSGSAAACAHVEMGDDLAIEEARVDPLIGREWNESQGFGTGQYITPARLCWAPGVRFSAGLTFTQDAYGVWTVDEAAR